VITGRERRKREKRGTFDRRGEGEGEKYRRGDWRGKEGNDLKKRPHPEF